ncbi:MAG: hypothetical protein Q7J10_10880, partial [Methanosarcinaceae archaeon]|nr:hypothetical protein [Methanosarcinaceae archaeon]
TFIFVRIALNKNCVFCECERMVGMEHAACGGVDAWGFWYLKYAPAFHQIHKYDKTISFTQIFHRNYTNTFF